MSLADVIVEIENGTFDRSVNTGVTPAIEIQIREELAIASMNEARETLFSDAKILHDRIIEKYLSLDQETRQFMADVYVREEVFREKATIASSTKKRLKNEFKKHISPSKTNPFLLLHHISSYSKILPLLEKYVTNKKKLKSVTASKAWLQAYLRNQGLRSWVQYNFIAGTMQKNSKTEIPLFTSLTYGLPEELKQQVQDAMTLKHHREKIISQYVTHVKSLKTPTISDVGLHKFLIDKNLGALYEYNFQLSEKWSNNEPRDIFASLSFELPKNIKKEFRDCVTFIHSRERLLNEYIRDMCKLAKPNLRDVQLQKYLVDRGLKSWLDIDFSKPFWSPRQKNRLRHGSISSIFHAISEELVTQVNEVRNLQPHRKRVLNEYVQYMKNLESPNIHSTKLPAYLNRNGLESWLNHNFSSRDLPNSDAETDHITSLTYGLSKELKQEVINASKLLSNRESVLKQYVDNVEQSNDPARYSLYGFLSQKKILSWWRYDFINSVSWSSKPNIASRLRSLTYGIRNKTLVNKVKKYAVINNNTW